MERETAYSVVAERACLLRIRDTKAASVDLIRALCCASPLVPDVGITPHSCEVAIAGGAIRMAREVAPVRVSAVASGTLPVAKRGLACAFPGSREAPRRGGPDQPLRGRPPCCGGKHHKHHLTYSQLALTNSTMNMTTLISFRAQTAALHLMGKRPAQLECTGGPLLPRRLPIAESPPDRWSEPSQTGGCCAAAP